MKICTEWAIIYWMTGKKLRLNLFPYWFGCSSIQETSTSTLRCNTRTWKLCVLHYGVLLSSLRLINRHKRGMYWFRTTHATVFVSTFATYCGGTCWWISLLTDSNPTRLFHLPQWITYFITCWETISYLLTPRSRVLPEKLTGFQVAKKFPALEPEGSLPHSQVPAICPYPEPSLSSPYPQIPLPDDPS